MKKRVTLKQLAQLSTDGWFDYMYLMIENGNQLSLREDLHGLSMRELLKVSAACFTAIQEPNWDNKIISRLGYLVLNELDERV